MTYNGYDQPIFWLLQNTQPSQPITWLILTKLNMITTKQHKNLNTQDKTTI